MTFRVKVDHEWDVTLLVAAPARSAQADFSPPYMQTDDTYLVPAGSSKHTWISPACALRSHVGTAPT